MAHLLTDEQRVAIARKERCCVLVELAHSDEFWLAIYRRDTERVWDVIHALNNGPTHLEPGGGNGGTQIERRQEGGRIEDRKTAEQAGSGEGSQSPQGIRRGDGPEAEGIADGEPPRDKSGSIRVVDCEPGGDKPPGTRHP